MLQKFSVQLILSFTLGALASFAMTPYGLFPILFVSLGFLYSVTLKSPRPLYAFAYGWVFSFGFFLFGLSWVGNALLVDGNPYAWAWPLAVCGLPFLLAFFQAFACLLSRKFFSLEKFTGFLAFVILSAFFEWARGHVFTGFPWNLYGHTWAQILPMLQILSVIDVYGLTFLTILWTAAAGFVFASPAPAKTKKLLGLFVVASFLFCLSFGFWRLQQPPVPVHDNIRVHMVQANIAQADKWKRENLLGHFQKHLKLSYAEDTSFTGTTLVVWAETSISPWVLEDQQSLNAIKQMLSSYKGPAYLLVGMLRYETDTDRYYNSLVMINAQGRVSNIYDKNHLVPFGEYIPFQKWIPLEPVARFKGFSGEGKAQTFTTPEGLKYSPAICYEIIFSGTVIDRANPPDVIVNVTNDSWYGESSGPHQHLYQAVFRAIEEGIPIVRVADTGVSAVIDGFGHIVDKTDLFTEDQNTLALPAKIMAFNANIITKEQLFIAFLMCLLCFCRISEGKK